MAAMTYADMVQFLKDRNVSDSSARSIRNYKKIIHDANFALHNEGKFEFDRRSGRLSYEWMKNAGTVNLGYLAEQAIFHDAGIAAGDAGRFVRFQGEPLSYLIDHLSGQNVWLATPYQSEWALTSAKYEITSDRMPLPAQFRDFCDPILHSTSGRLEPRDMSDMQLYRQTVRTAGTPAYYGLESAAYTDDDDNVTQRWYCWLNPAPRELTAIDFMYYAWPEQPEDNDDLFGLPVDAEPVLREFAKAFLLQEQNGLGDPSAMTQMQFAKNICRKALSHFLPKVGAGQRELWTPGADGGCAQAAPAYLPLR